MSYYSYHNLKSFGFKYLGDNVKISSKASIYNCEQIEIGDNTRVDDFGILSRQMKIGSFVHVTPMCLLAGGDHGIEVGDFCTFAYAVKIFTQSDDYSGETMANSNIPAIYKNEYKSKVIIHKHSIVGADSIIMLGIILAEGTSVGAMPLVLKSTDEWSIYIGNSATKLRKRSKNLLNLEEKFLQE